MGTVTNNFSFSAATAYGNQRHLDRCQNGVQWTFTTNPTGSSTLGYLYYSTDNGATWTSSGDKPNGSGTVSSSYQQNASFYIDVDDYAHLAFKDNANGYIYYQRGTPNAARTAYTWSAAVVLWDGAAYDVPDLVAYRDPANAGAWVALVVASQSGSSNGKAHGWLLRIASTGTVTGGGSAGRILISSDTATANSNLGYPSVDFNHTGDGKTVAGGTPHLYVAWSNGAAGAGYGIRFRKATYASGSWTWGTEREIDNQHYAAGTIIPTLSFDGTRCVIAGEATNANGTNYDIVLHDRDAADTTTTPRTILTSINTTANELFTGSSTYDGAGNMYLFGADGTGANGTRKVNYRRWVRSTGNLDNIVTFDTTGPTTPYVSARRGPQGGAIDYVYTDGTASPYTVTSGRITLNAAPTAPTNITPADGTTYDSSADRTVTFVHNDPDGDAASSYRLRFRPAGITTTYAYLTGTTTAANGATVSVTVPAGTWAGQVTFAAETYDASGTEGAWSSNVTITGIPSALAAATGGQGGTAAPALSLYNQFRAEQAARTSGRSALATVASLSPLQITVDGSTVNATRNAGYTPTLGDLVDVGLINDTWVIRDRVV